MCEDERLRLMWIGRGLWFNLGFYQHFQRRVRRRVRLVDVPRDRGRRLPPLRRAAAARARGAVRGVHRPPRHARLGRPVVPEGGAARTASTASSTSSRRVAEPLLRHARARGGGDPRARDRRQQRRRARLGRGRRSYASSLGVHREARRDDPAAPPRRPDPRRARPRLVLRAEPRAAPVGRPRGRPRRGAAHGARRPEQRRHPCAAGRSGAPRGAAAGRGRRRDARRQPHLRLGPERSRGHDRGAARARDRRPPAPA